MILEAASVAVMLGDFIYHRIKDDRDLRENAKPKRLKFFQGPLVEEGAPIPMIFGRCRVRQPILAWRGKARSDVGDVSNSSPSAPFIYLLDQFYVLGFAMNDGNATSDVHQMWAGDTKFKNFNLVPGTAEMGRSLDVDESTIVEIYHGGNSVEIFDGDPAQELADASGTPLCEIADRMINDSDTAIAGTEIPGYRGYISIGLSTTGGYRWSIGASPTVPAYSFEVSSYVDSGYPGVATYARVGMDSNPMNVLYDLLKATFGKAGIDATLYIDPVSFGDAAVTLKNEGNGYSMCIDSIASLEDHITDILEQIDAILYSDETDGLIKIKLIRNDYDIRDLPHITKDVCDDPEDFAMGGRTNLINKVRIVFPNRDTDYNDDSAIAQNTANAAGQDGEVNEEVIQRPGVCDANNAQRIANRELAWRSRPFMKLSVLVKRSFLRVNPGDAVKVTLNNPDISGIVFRVVAVDRGTLENGAIRVDLVQDHFYTYRQVAPQPPGLDHPDIGGGILIDFGSMP